MPVGGYFPAPEIRRGLFVSNRPGIAMPATFHNTGPLCTCDFPLRFHSDSAAINALYAKHISPPVALPGIPRLSRRLSVVGVGELSGPPAAVDGALEANAGWHAAVMPPVAFSSPYLAKAILPAQTAFAPRRY